MVVHDANGLQKGIGDDGTAEGDAAPLHVGTHAPRYIGDGRDVLRLLPVAIDALAVGERPQIGIKGDELLLYPFHCLGVLPYAEHLTAVADDVCIVQYDLQFLVGHGGATVYVEVVERRLIGFPLVHDGAPRKAHAGALQTEHLELETVVVAHAAPFVVMVILQYRVAFVH